MIEFSQPVVPDGEDIDAEPGDILDLLAVMVFDYHLIHVGTAADVLKALFHGIDHRILAPLIRELIRSDSDDQPVAQFLRSFQKADVPLVEQVKNPVGYNSLHFLLRPFCLLSRDSSF